MLGNRVLLQHPLLNPHLPIHIHVHNLSHAWRADLFDRFSSIASWENGIQAHMPRVCLARIVKCRMPTSLIHHASNAWCNLNGVRSERYGKKESKIGNQCLGPPLLPAREKSIPHPPSKATWGSASLPHLNLLPAPKWTSPSLTTWTYFHVTLLLFVFCIFRNIFSHMPRISPWFTWH